MPERNFWSILLLASVVGCASPILLPERFSQQGTAYWAGVSSPLNAYTYVRTDELLCAVRFTDLRAEPGKQLPTSGQYESICFPRNGLGPLAVNPVKNTGTVKGEGYRCYMRIEDGCVFAEVITQVVVLGTEQMAIAWQRPNGLTFLSASKGQPFLYRSNVELAPTAVRSSDRIDFSATSLRWFKLDQEAPRVAIPVSELPN